MSKKYEVVVYEVHTRTIEVEADSVDEAIDKANDVMEEGDGEIDLEYSHMLDMKVFFNGKEETETEEEEEEGE